MAKSRLVEDCVPKSENRRVDRRSFAGCIWGYAGEKSREIGVLPGHSNPPWPEHFPRLPRKLLILHPLRLDAVRPQAAHFVFFVGFKVALEPFHMRIAFEGQNMRAQAV